MTESNDTIGDLGKMMLDVTTFAGLSTAYYVALREITEDEHTRIKNVDKAILSKLSKVMSRVRFVDNLRYVIQLDTLGPIDGIDRDGLETYLLCTCLDTLAGKNDYYDLQTWLNTSSSKNANILGLSEKSQIFQTETTSVSDFSEMVFQKIVGNILQIYNSHYGVNSNIKKMLLGLPDYLKSEISEQYIIKDNESWNKKTIDERIKSIFIDYLFPLRRNSYTHSSEVQGSFGGISEARKSLNSGNVQLPQQYERELKRDGKGLKVICKCGDESLFLRETIIACIADGLGLLDATWLKRYRTAELFRRVLVSLSYELEYNINLLQGYSGLLSQGLIMRDQENPHKMSTMVTSNIIEKQGDFVIPIEIPYLSVFFEQAVSFNKEINGLNNDRIRSLVSESSIVWHTQYARFVCETILRDYPRWTYDSKYFPELSSI